MDDARRPVEIERIHGGEPILKPGERMWESRAAVNAACYYLPPGAANEGVLRTLRAGSDVDPARLVDGIVAVQYGAVGRLATSDPTYRTCQGLALFTPDFELLKRLDRPVILPSASRDDPDWAGVEDARLSRIGDTFYACYCGFNGVRGRACVATSQDLLSWTKHGELPGDLNRTQNKDHVLFQERIQGLYWMLHRPWGEPLAINDYAIRLASSEGPLGPWTDRGQIMHAYENPRRLHTWLGAGTVPIPLGDQRYLMIYHTGSRLRDGYRQYDAAAALLDFARYDPSRPESLVQSRLEPIMVPETEWEKNPDPSLRIDIVFPVGSFVRGDSLTMVYGAGDRYTCAARLPFRTLLERLETAGHRNPD